MQQSPLPIELPSVECDYQPDPSTLAGFLASLSRKVDELLLAAKWQPSWYDESPSEPSHASTTNHREDRSPHS
jgi:hypothetical protein